MTLIKDLIFIPERVHQGDFVLKLSEGVLDAQATLRDYVVTPQLVDCFENAMGFIKQAVQSGGSKAAYLHGSFGAGKSHFMAVLSLLLEGNTHARATPELADVVARHGWAQQKRFLLVPYHMVGALDMESAILGQYAEFVRRRHPDAPVPGFYLAEGLFGDAQSLRAQIGEQAFFDKLNQAPSSTPSESANATATANANEWGQLEGGWDAISYAAAVNQPPHGEARGKLVGALISQFFTAYRTLANSGESYVPLDAGLSILTRHAQALGYDAVILFLDELVLWLASHAADPNFVSREGTKLVKLVEATDAQRPIPLISFVARQRDLRDLVGENLSGSAQAHFSDAVRHWEARFHRITLEDRNLPAIAEKRVLRPLNEAARQTMQAGFEDIARLRKEVFETLLTTTADREMFQKVYPFSPALVQTLIAVSSALQRERTALKLMLQLLVDRRDDLELGQLIPVGDLYDAISDGDEPFSTDMRIHFDNAKRLYSKRLLPMLERQHNVTLAAIKSGQADPQAAKNLRNDARLLKTLLLAALVPEVEALKGLTGARLSALNHGSFKSPIPNREGADIVRKCRDWSTEIAEIKITDDNSNNNLISIQVTGLDIEPIVRAAIIQDTGGNQCKAIREMLFAALGLVDESQLFTNYKLAWRGTWREVELLFENVQEMSAERLRGRGGIWSVVLDFPFDEDRTQLDHSAALAEYRSGDTSTLVWLASFFSNKAMADLGRLVVLQHILSGDRFDGYALHLSLADKVHARALAKNQLDQLRIKLRSQIEVAYGISSEPRDAIHQALPAEQQFQSLDPTFAPRPPVGANLKEAFDALLGQLFAHQFPAHPEFDAEIKTSNLKKIWPELQRAIEAEGHRGMVTDANLRKTIRAVVNPLRLATMGEGPLLIERHWDAHFSQCHAKDGGGKMTVAQVRRWIDQPKAMGLPLEVQNLLILTFAGITNRRFLLRGGPIEPGLDNLSDELELREQALPDAAEFASAVKRAAALFGLTLPQSLNASSVGRLLDEVQRVVKERHPHASALVSALRERAGQYGAAQEKRQNTAETALAMLANLANLAQAEQLALVKLLAHEGKPSSSQIPDAVLACSIAQAQQVAQVVQNTHWNIFESMRELTELSDHRQTAASRILDKLQEALANDELVIPLKSRIDQLERDALGLLTQMPPAVAPVAHLPTSTTQADTTGLDGKNAAVDYGTAQTSVALTGNGNGMPSDETESGQMKAERLNHANAKALWQSLQAKLEQDHELELVLQWKLSRRSDRP